MRRSYLDLSSEADPREKIEIEVTHIQLKRTFELAESTIALSLKKTLTLDFSRMLKEFIAGWSPREINHGEMS